MGSRSSANTTSESSSLTRDGIAHGQVSFDAQRLLWFAENSAVDARSSVLGVLAKGQPRSALAS